MSEYIQVATTTATAEEAGAIAGMLVEKRLAACVQVVGPIISHYRWLGKIENSREYICLAKTMTILYPAIEEAIKEVHSYELPEIVAMPLIAGSREYLAWLAAEVWETR